jgi:hypothetical protein
MNNDTTANPLEPGNDENERLALEECVKRQRFDRRVSVLVSPAGQCEQAIKFARLGAQVVVVDKVSLQREIEGRILASGLKDDITYLPYELADLPDEATGEPFDIAFIRRGLCGLPYQEARQIVRQTLLKMKIGGRMYLSIHGMYSELSRDYPDIDQPLDQRYSELSPAMAEKYGIKQKVCLYSERDLFMLLLDAGASVLRTLTTTYGNVKAVAVRI